MEYDVTIDRELYIGGSDIPAIMGISSFKTRWELLLEKAGLKQSDFEGNRYTEYGNIIEPQIRDYINRRRKNKFEPNRVINGDIRYHADGFNGDTVLEIKSTSHIFETVDEYKVYLVQLLKGMEENKVKRGILAVYHRPEDFNPEFNPKRLQVFNITIGQYKTLLDEINAEIGKFRADLERLKANPLLTEQDFQPPAVVKISQAVVVLEKQVQSFKEVEAEYKRMKQALFAEMQKHDIKSWEMPNGTKITRVDGTAATVMITNEFDLDTFKAENPALYEMYLKEVEKTTSGKSGYVKITLPKQKAGVSDD